MRLKYIALILLSFIFVFSLNSCALFEAAAEKIERADAAEEENAEGEPPLEEEKEDLDDEESNDPGKGDAVSEEYADQIRVFNPLPGQSVKSPLIVEGEARGMWFFEADFPVKLLDANGNVIIFHYAEAQSDWMTEEFVPFKSELVFEKPDTPTGILVLIKDNPSGLPENDDEYAIPVNFE